MTKRIFRTVFLVAILVMFATLILTTVFLLRYSAAIRNTEYPVVSVFVELLIPLIVISVLAIVVSLFLASRTSKRIVQPFNEIDLDDPLAKNPYPEMKPLLTRVAKQQSELKRTSQIRQEFTANVSHELKTPLHVISGYVELLKNNLVQPEDTQAFYDKIYSETRRMSSLVEDIIELSHLDSGADDMKKENVDLSLIAKNAVDSLSLIAENAQVELRLDQGSAEPVMVYGVPSLLYEIIYNLCDNSIKYNHPEGYVHVAVYEKDGEAVLEVSDNGTGIPKAHQGRIFERFYRVDKSRSKEVGGTGLGLSIVKHAAELHKATIDVDSHVGRGTTIVVKFPENRLIY